MRVYAHYNVVQNQKRPLEVEERVKQVDKRQKVDKPVKEDKDALYKRQLDKLAKKNPNLYSLLEESDLVERVLNVGKNAASKEEDLLKDLEKKLGIKDKKKLQKSFGADGLDDLLSGIQVGSRDVNDAAAEAEEESGSEQGSMEETFDIQESDADTESEQGSMEEEFDMDGSDSDDGSTQESETSAAQEAPVAVGKYIPPSMRAKPTTKSEQQLVVARKLQGLINRLSESNIESIVNDIESLYQQYPRNDVTSTWTDILLQSITSTAFVNDELVVVYACLVSCLYALIGVDAAAHFVQTVMESFLSKYAAVKNEPQDGVKHCTNVVALLAELYNFGVVSNVLAYDLIRTWIDHLNELSVELLLKLLRLSGPKLRQDDPASLKEISLLVQDRFRTLDPTQISTRMKFMAETITSLKNNKMRAQIGSSVTQDTVTRLKKFLAAFSKKKRGYQPEPLGASLADIESVHVKGKWWLVGASWAGRAPTTPAPKQDTASHALLELARRHNMNTDIRRSIFLALMGSQDYVDAFENLMKLKLTDAQNREIVRVILHCASNEQAYNPYYGFVALKLCTYKHDYRVTFQYAFWDFLRSLGEEDVGSGQPVDIHDVPLSKMVHMAKLYGWLIGQDGLSILILRSINFTALQKQTQTFMRVLFTSLLASCRKHPQMNEGEALVNVFSKSKQVEGLVHGLLFCLHHYVQNESKTLAMNILSKLK